MKKAVLLVLVLFIAPALIYGCSRAAKQADYAPAPMAESMAAPAPMAKGAAADKAPGGSGAPQVVIPTKLIRTAQVQIRTDDIEKDLGRIKDRVKELGGYEAGMNLNLQNRDALSASFTAKVPAESLDAFVDFLRKEFKVMDLSTTSEDVSEEYVDVESRLHNAKVQEKRLLEILETKTGKLEELLTVESEIARVRETIEQIEGRKRFLDTRIGLSTVNIGLTQIRPLDVPEEQEEGFWASIKDTFNRTGESFTGALADSIRALVYVAKLVILLIAYVAPFALAGFVFLYVLIKLVKLARLRKTKPPKLPGE